MTLVTRLAAVAAFVFLSSGLINAGVTNAQAPPRIRVVKLTNVAPAYPAEARAQKLGGTVQVRIVIGTDGSVLEADVTRGVHASLDAAAVQAVRRWKYLPMQVNGQPFELETTVPVTFTAEP